MFCVFFNVKGILSTSFRDETVTIKITFWCRPPPPWGLFGSTSAAYEAEAIAMFIVEPDNDLKRPFRLSSTGLQCDVSHVRGTFTVLDLLPTT